MNVYARGLSTLFSTVQLTENPENIPAETPISTEKMGKNREFRIQNGSFGKRVTPCEHRAIDSMQMKANQI